MNVMKFEGIGTHWQIDIYSPLSEEKKKDLQLLIYKRIEEFEKNYSRFRPDSFVNVGLNKVGKHLLPKDADPLLSLYKKLYTITDGLFTPFIAQVLIDAGYDREYSLKSKNLQTPPKWDTVMSYNFPEVIIKQPAALDFGAAGKGYLIDLVAVIIREFGVKEFCIDAGGDIRYESNNPLRVGLENPLDMSQAIGVVTLTNMSLCASSGSRRSWGTFHHIINPHTLSSPKNIIATWVVSQSTLLSDALATSLFLVMPTLLIPHFSFEYLVLFADSSFEKSPSFPAELFLK